MLFGQRPEFCLDESGAGGGDSPATGGQSQAQQPSAEQWQARLSGLQSKYDTETQVAKAQIANLTNQLGASQSELGTHKDSIKEWEKKFGASDASLKAVQAQHDSAVAEAKGLQAQISRGKLVMEKFPHLVSLEARGLLPQAAPDQLEGVLATFAATLADMTKASLQNALAGAAPASPAPAGVDPVESLSNEDLYKQMMNPPADAIKAAALEKEWLKRHKK